MSYSVRIGGLKGYSEVVTRLGGDPKEFLERCDIPYDVLDDEENTILYANMVALIEYTAKCLKKPDFGLYLGQYQKVDILGPMSVAIQTAEAVSDAMKCMARFLHIQNPALQYYIDDDHPDYVRAIMNVSLPNLSHRDMPQTVGRAAALGQEMFMQVAREHFEIIKVEIPHEPLLPVSMYESYFNAALEFNSESVVWHISKETYNAKLPLHSDRLHRFASQYLTEQFPAQAKRLSVMVERELRKLMESGSCTRDTIADLLNLHPKTMQRRLAQEDCNFEGIRDKVRRERASYYLCNTDMPFSQVADRIGYSDQAALSRSCQRWFSRSPREIRSENKSLVQSQHSSKIKPELSS
ncbi:AraC family transcriptional regulator [Pseudoteredinibacter isoporae]|uniref:AraC family transcriptional regulator n=1 Tax=Pseudoteredinibacter isoporae TaxID=570281 RepID=UPI00310211EF